MMNRIILKYKPRKGNITSSLEIRNDLKGLTNEQIGTTFYGKDADIMFDLLRAVDYSDLENYMDYGVIIVDEAEVKNK